jgi:hypothetical protein
MFTGYAYDQLYVQNSPNIDMSALINTTDEITGLPRATRTDFFLYDCTSRPWYRAAVLHGGVWSQPCLSTRSYGLSITAARRFLKDSGDVLGVFGAACTISKDDTVLASSLSPFCALFKSQMLLEAHKSFRVCR